MTVVNLTVLLPEGWKPLGDGFYARPLVASEASMAARNTRFDGHNDVCMGFVFRTKLQNIRQAVIEALLQLRNSAPLVAADISPRAEFGGVSCWVYKTPATADEALQWAERSLAIHDPAPSDEDFIPSIAETRLPYEPLAGLKQYVGFHLLLRPDGVHSLFIHGTHAILDAQPNLFALRKIFIAIADFKTSFMKGLAWGQEVRNLPLDLVSALGGMRHIDVEDHGLEIVGCDKQDKPSLGLLPERDTVKCMGRPRMALKILDEATTKSLLAQLKKLGSSATILLDAALMLLTFARNCPMPKDSHVTLDLTVIALQRFLPPSVKSEDYITSCMIFVPLVGESKDLDPSLPLRQRLLAVMSLVRSQYSDWLARPNIAFADIIGHPALPIHRNPYTPFISNLGVIDRYVDRTLPAQGSDPVVEIVDFKFGHRIVNFHRPAFHGWTFQDRLFLQIQSTDVFEVEYLQGCLDELVTIMLCLLDN